MKFIKHIGIGVIASVAFAIAVAPTASFMSHLVGTMIFGAWIGWVSNRQ